MKMLVPHWQCGPELPQLQILYLPIHFHHVERLNNILNTASIWLAATTVLEPQHQKLYWVNTTAVAVTVRCQSLLKLEEIIQFTTCHDFILDCTHKKIFTAHRIASAVLVTAIPSVRPSVCLSHAGIVSKRLHIARWSLHCQIAKCV